MFCVELLYLIEFLHQTTTTGCVRIDFMAFMPGFPTEKNGFELRGSRFDVFFRISKNKYSKISQKNSNCWGISGFARSLFPQKFRISPYCLSVTARMLVYPEGGIERRTRLM